MRELIIDLLGRGGWVGWLSKGMPGDEVPHRVAHQTVGGARVAGLVLGALEGLAESQDVHKGLLVCRRIERRELCVCVLYKPGDRLASAGWD